MQSVPLQAVPSQTMTLILAGQQVGLSIYLLADSSMHMDITLNSAPVVTGVVCRNNIRFVRNLYFGFLGDFVFNDTQGTDDPTYDGLGTRYQLLYLSATETLST